VIRATVSRAARHGDSCHGAAVPLAPLGRAGGPHAASNRRPPVRARRRVSSAESSEERARATRAGRRRRTSRAAREEQRFRMLPAPAAARSYAPDRGVLGPGSGGRYSGRGSNGSTATRRGWLTSFDPKMCCCCCCDMTTVPRTRSMCTAWTPRRQASSTINSRRRIDRSHGRRRTRPHGRRGDDRSSSARVALPPFRRPSAPMRTTASSWRARPSARRRKQSTHERRGLRTRARRRSPRSVRANRPWPFPSTPTIEPSASVAVSCNQSTFTTAEQDRQPEHRVEQPRPCPIRSSGPTRGSGRALADTRDVASSWSRRSGCAGTRAVRRLERVMMTRSPRTERRHTRARCPRCRCGSIVHRRGRPRPRSSPAGWRGPSQRAGRAILPRGILVVRRRARRARGPRLSRRLPVRQEPGQTAAATRRRPRRASAPGPR
jgi:hypothetical protein